MKNLYHMALTAIIILLSACSGGGNTDSQSESIELNWDIPSTRYDGSPLAMNELNGYKIFQRINNSVFTELVYITDAQVNQFTVSNVTTGQYQYYITAFDVDGNASPLSNTVEKIIP